MLSWYGSFGSSQLRLLTFAGIKRDLTTATAVIAGIGSVAFGFLTNLPVALAYVPDSWELSGTDKWQAWHGSQCILYISGRWLPWNWISVLWSCPHGSLHRRVDFRLSLAHRHAAMARQNYSCFGQSRKRSWYWHLPDRNRHVLFRDWPNIRIQCHAH